MALATDGAAAHAAAAPAPQRPPRRRRRSAASPQPLPPAAAAGSDRRGGLRARLRRPRACASWRANSASISARSRAAATTAASCEADVEAFAKGGAARQRRAAAAAAARRGGGGIDLLPWPKVDFAKFGPVERKELSRIKKISGANLHRNWVVIPHVTNARRGRHHRPRAVPRADEQGAREERRQGQHAAVHDEGGGARR